MYLSSSSNQQQPTNDNAGVKDTIRSTTRNHWLFTQQHTSESQQNA